MSDTPLWTIDLKVTRTKLGKRVESSVRQMVLRCVLEVLPGLDADSFKTYAEAVRDDLQRAAETITGTEAEMRWIANTVSVHFAKEHMDIKTDATRDRAEASSYWASKIYKHVRDDPADAVRKAPPKPVKLVAKSLFGDEG